MPLPNWLTDTAGPILGGLGDGLSAAGGAQTNATVEQTKAQTDAEKASNKNMMYIVIAMGVVLVIVVIWFVMKRKRR